MTDAMTWGDGGTAVPDDVVDHVADDVNDVIHCGHLLCWTRAVADRIAPLVAVQALRLAADEVERDGGTILTALWAADALRQRADELERGTDHVDD